MSSFDSIQVTRESVDAFEGSTLKRHQADTRLGIVPTDESKATTAKTETKVDLVSGASKHVFQSDEYANKTELLNDLVKVDDDNMIQTLMTYKFLELLFSDEHIGETDGGAKAQFYEVKYNQQIPKVITTLLADLEKPKTPNITRFRR